MPEYRVTFTIVDVNNSTTTKTFTGTFTDYAAAETAAADLLADYDVATAGAIQSQSITAIGAPFFVGSPVGAGTRVFERAALTTLLVNNERYQLDIPAPNASLFVPGTNTVDVSSTIVTDLLANFGPGLFTVSDGEHLQANAVKGKRLFRASGSTQIP